MPTPSAEAATGTSRASIPGQTCAAMGEAMTNKAEIREGLEIAIRQVETIQAALTAPATTNDGLKAAAQTLRQRLRATLLTLSSEPEPLAVGSLVDESGVWHLNLLWADGAKTCSHLKGLFADGDCFGVTITRKP